MRKWLRVVLWVVIAGSWGAATLTGAIDRMQDNGIGGWFIYLVATTVATLIGWQAGRAITPLPIENGDPTRRAPEWDQGSVLAVLVAITGIVGVSVIFAGLPTLSAYVFLAFLALATFAWYEGPLRPSKKPR